MTAGEDEQQQVDGETRLPVIVVVAAIAVALALGLGLRVVAGGRGEVFTPAGPTPQELALETAEAWLAAWEDGAVDDMTALAGGDAEVAPAVRSMHDALRVGGLVARVTDRPDVAFDEGSATVPFRARLAIGTFGTWSYDGRLELTVPPEPVDDGDDGGDEAEEEPYWFVAFRPSTLHPTLGDDGVLDLRVTWPERAGITAADGTPLPAPGVPGLNGQVVGALAPASPERAAELGAPYEEGHVVGVSGLQAAQERRLAGTPTAEVVVAGTGQILHAYPGTAPEPVHATVDLGLQAAAEAVAGSAGRPTALVAVRPSTHEVVAVASAPAGGFGRALAGRYPPGSTFKVVTSTALLAAGTTPDSPAPCPETANVGGRTFRNAEGAALGDIVFRRAFFESCNTAFVQLADALAPEQLVAAAEAHGFNQELTAFGMPAYSGSYPLPEGRVDQAASAIGQGRVLASPLQMAVVAANVASGVHRQPRIVAGGPPDAGTPLPEGVAPTLQELMRLVVAEGTATRAQLPGEPVRGKTGTAEFGTARPPRTHAWFIGFRGDLAVAVVVEDGGFGGQVAAPLAGDFLGRVG
jgi:hypothetical protein